MSVIPSQRKPQRREIELDFIRGLAILMVLDFHMPKTILLAPFLWLGFKNFGWAGVDVFFVLSGFLVGGLLVKEWQLKSRIDSKRFLIRRAFKSGLNITSSSLRYFSQDTRSSMFFGETS
jgi:peptidoglycan/LPS O-acetylase OafA/YrhL